MTKTVNSCFSNGMSLYKTMSMNSTVKTLTQAAF